MHAAESGIACGTSRGFESTHSGGLHVCGMDAPRCVCGMDAPCCVCGRAAVRGCAHPSAGGRVGSSRGWPAVARGWPVVAPLGRPPPQRREGEDWDAGWDASHGEGGRTSRERPRRYSSPSPQPALAGSRRATRPASPPCTPLSAVTSAASRLPVEGEGLGLGWGRWVRVEGWSQRLRPSLRWTPPAPPAHHLRRPLMPSLRGLPSPSLSPPSTHLPPPPCVPAHTARAHSARTQRARTARTHSADAPPNVKRQPPQKSASDPASSSSKSLYRMLEPTSVDSVNST
eukprot:1137891-Prymnesium_polylepis.1